MDHKFQVSIKYAESLLKSEKNKTLEKHFSLYKKYKEKRISKPWYIPHLGGLFPVADKRTRKASMNGKNFYNLKFYFF